MGGAATPKEKTRNADCSSKKWFGEKRDKDGQCTVCDSCRDSEKDRCRLMPYKPNCCKPKTGHHVIPKRCFQKDGKSFIPNQNGGTIPYNADDAPCICVTGATRNKQHGKIHKKFDRLERDAGKADKTWTYPQARDAAADAVNSVFPECKQGCMAAQLDSYHQDDLNMNNQTRLRANPSGKGPVPRKALSNTNAGLSAREE